jgi:hypothetical protein
VLGNVLITRIIVLVLYRFGAGLKTMTPTLHLAALLLAVGSMAAVRLMRIGDPVVSETFAICNANRHVGLALLLSLDYVRAARSQPAIVCYALIAPIVIIVYAKWYRGAHRSQTKRRER